MYFIHTHCSVRAMKNSFSTVRHLHCSVPGSYSSALSSFAHQCSLTVYWLLLVFSVRTGHKLLSQASTTAAAAAFSGQGWTALNMVCSAISIFPLLTEKVLVNKEKRRGNNVHQSVYGVHPKKCAYCVCACLWTVYRRRQLLSSFFNQKQ